MKIELTREQKAAQEEFHAFSQEHIVPYADDYDKAGSLPPEIVKKVAQKGYLGAFIPQEYAGLGHDMLTIGLLHEEIGRGCSSLRSLLTVHGMVSFAISKWGTRSQKEQWLPRLATGEVIAAFGLTEPHAGNDINSMASEALPDGDDFVLNGQKKWVTYGQLADLFLFFARCNGVISAFLVERNTPGLSMQPITDVLGTRASLLAELHLRECRIPKTGLVGKPGSLLATTVASCLDIGRYSVACGCVGIAQACLDASLQYINQRQQFGAYLKDHQLIQQMISDMVTQTRAARLLCYHAGYLKQIGDPETIMATWIAKYFSSTTAHLAARHAVQIHGANGCSSHYPVQRYLRDATVMEIIEGSTQIQQITIARYASQAW